MIRSTIIWTYQLNHTIFNQQPGQSLDSLKRGKRSATIDLKKDAGKQILKNLCSNADILIEPFRPGVMERLGLGPNDMMQLNDKLIYARLTGYGQVGQYAKRAGHDINYLAISGALSLFTNDKKPTPPINMLADFAGGGMSCALGIMIALFERSKSNKGQVVDVSMVEGTRYISTYLWHTQKDEADAKPFIWPNPGSKEANLLDGGAHFYTSYKTKDNRWMSVGAIEPQFYERLLSVLELDESKFPQFDIGNWPKYKEALAGAFAGKTMKDWVELFKDADACVEPILEYHEAESWDDKELRSSFNSDHTPKPAPLLSRTPGQPNLREPRQSEDTREILLEHGYTPQEISDLSEGKVIECLDIGNSKL